MDIFIDGSCPNNGKAGARAAFAWAAADRATGTIKETYAERIDASKPQTNQYAELAAFQYAFKRLDGTIPVTIYSDSDYAIKCITTWGPAWKANGWRRKATGAGGKPIEHIDVIRPMVEYYEAHKEQLTVVHLRSHQSAAVSATYPYSGNVVVDRLALATAL